MKMGLRGWMLPETGNDFAALAKCGQARYPACYDCGEAFSPANVHSERGWAETQISGMCENCWDALFANEEDDDE